MKYIALLLGLLIATPAMAQNPNTAGSKDTPSTQGPSAKRQDQKGKQKDVRGAKPKPGPRIDPGLAILIHPIKAAAGNLKCFMA